jgi:hypothetical protein
MRSLRSGPFLTVFALTIVIGPLVGRSFAQSPSELRRENERLKTQVAELEREVAQKQTEIDRLQAENAQLRAGGAAQGRAPLPPLEPEEVSIDETKPAASPRALLAAAVTGYRAVTKDLVLESEGPERLTYQRAVEKWAKRAAREYRMPVEWHVRVVGPVESSGRGYSIRLQAVDPKTDTLLGDPFEGLLTKTEQARLAQRERTLSGDVFVMKGTAMPEIVYEPERTAAGPFDNPRFIGPFAEFTLVVDVQSIAEKPQEPENKEEKKNDGEGTSPLPEGR